MNLLNRTSPSLEDLTKKFNSFYLVNGRKSPEIMVGSGEHEIPYTTTYGIMNNASLALRDKGINVDLNDPGFNIKNYDPITQWNIFWALELQTAMSLIDSAGGSREASGYDTKVLPLRGHHYDMVVHNVASMFPGNNIVGLEFGEFGVGSGLGMAKLAEKGAYVSGVEQAVMGEEFARYLTGEVYKVGGNVRNLVVGDFYEKHFDDNQFDGTLCSGVIEHEEYDEGLELLSEMARVTKPGGYIFVTEPNEGSPFYQRYKERERKTQKNYPRLIRIPDENNRHSHNVQQQITDVGLHFVKKEGLQVAASSSIKQGDIQEGDVPHFNRHLLDQEYQISVTNKIAHLTNLETFGTDEFRTRYGWSLMYVARKSGGNSTNGPAMNPMSASK